MGFALKVEPLNSLITTIPVVNTNPRVAIRPAGYYELTADEVEVLEFRCQALQACMDLDAMRMEELTRD